MTPTRKEELENQKEYSKLVPKYLVKESYESGRKDGIKMVLGLIHDYQNGYCNRDGVDGADLYFAPEYGVIEDMMKELLKSNPELITQ